MHKLIYLTNIPTPYRQIRFNKLNEILPKYGFELEVIYMAKIEPNRKWVLDKDSFKYKHKIYEGIQLQIGGLFAHFNPTLLLRLLKNDYDLIVIGGMASPTHWLSPFFISKKKIKVMSVESNMYSVRRKTGLAYAIKKILLSKMDAYQVTGEPQIDFIKYFYPKAIKKEIIRLPNLINEEVFINSIDMIRNQSKSNLRESFNVDEDIQMWVLPARLISIKGIFPFLEMLKNIKKIKLFLLGDGELRENINNFITKFNLPVTLAGFVQEEEILKYYAAADLFILPSIEDPSPLSPIEAIASGLPILVSSRIGNVKDVVKNGVNGWSYDPIDEVEKGKALVNKISQMSRGELSLLAKNSREIYNDNFNLVKTIISYAKSLKLLFNK